MIKVELSKYIDEQMLGTEKEINRLKLLLCDSPIDELVKIKSNIYGFEGQYFVLDRIARRLKNNYFEEKASGDGE